MTYSKAYLISSLGVLLALFVTTRVAFTNGDDQLLATNLDPASQAVVPADLQSAIESLQRSLSDADKAQLAATPEGDLLGRYQFGLGMWIRSTWLYDGSPLSKYFAAHGLSNEEVISAVMLRALHRHLNGKPISIEDLLHEQKRLEEALGRPNDVVCPNHPDVAMKLLPSVLSSDGRGSEVLRSTHFGYCPLDHTYWAYSFGHGWAKPTQDQLEFLKENYSYETE